MFRQTSHALVLLIAFILLATPAAQGATNTTPLPNARADYQLGGPQTPHPSVEIVVRDRKAKPAQGAYNICYVNAFQTQPDERKLWRKHKKLLLKSGGKLVKDTEWNEYIFDIRTAKKRAKLIAIIGPWINKCARDGFDGVEFDNLDSFLRSGKKIKARHAKKFARSLVKRAHRVNLTAGQKNWPDLNGRKLGFDFVVAEECARYRECGTYYRHYGTQIIAIEYRRKDFNRACAAHRGDFPIVLRDRALKPAGRRAWC